MFRSGRRPARPAVVVALAMALAGSTLVAGAPQPVAAAQYLSCTGGVLQPNALTVQWQWSGSQWQVYLSGYVAPVLVVGGTQVQLVTSAGALWSLGPPTTDGTYYYWSGSVDQSDLGLYNPGDTSTFWLHFAIPLQLDLDTCAITGSYSAPIPSPTPVPTPTPAPTIAVSTITQGQQETLTWSGGVPNAQVQWQTSPDLLSWSALTTVTLDASGSASYTFTPTQTAYYRGYAYSTGQYGTRILEVIVVPTPTPIPTQSTIQTIFTISAGQQTTIQSTGTPGATLQFQSSPDLSTWSALATVTVGSTGVATYTFAPTQTAYYRTYSYTTGLTSGAVRGVVLPAPPPSPTPTPAPSEVTPQPAAVQTIYTITAGQSETVTGQGTPGDTLTLESSLDGTQWSPLVTATVDGGGTASFTYRPATNLYLRITSAGANPSSGVRGLVRQLALLRPTNSGRVAHVRLGASVTFTTTVRPVGAAFPASVVTFVFYKLVGGHWTRMEKWQSYTDSSGRASWPWTFPSRGSWYMRSYSEGSSLNVASLWTPVERYDVE